MQEFINIPDCKNDVNYEKNYQKLMIFFLIKPIEILSWTNNLARRLEAHVTINSVQLHNISHSFQHSPYTRSSFENNALFEIKALHIVNRNNFYFKLKIIVNCLQIITTIKISFKKGISKI